MAKSTSQNFSEIREPNVWSSGCKCKITLNIELVILRGWSKSIKQVGEKRCINKEVKTNGIVFGTMIKMIVYNDDGAQKEKKEKKVSRRFVSVGYYRASTSEALVGGLVGRYLVVIFSVELFARCHFARLSVRCYGKNRVL